MDPSARYHLPVGRSVEGRELTLHTNFDPRAPIPPGLTFILGGTHGDEPASHILAEEFATTHLPVIPAPTVVWPLLNPDGLTLGTRYNARGVDLNRNCETAWSHESEEPSGARPWSEPESIALRDLIRGWQPAKIVTLHWALAELDADGLQSRPLLDAMWNTLSPAEQITYRRSLSTAPTLPGSLGAWCGYTLRYPHRAAPAIVTLELSPEPEKPRPAELAPDHLAVVHARWRGDACGYLETVRPGVTKMLLAACACVA